MQRYENRRQVLRRLRKYLCLCARGESSESGSEYVAKDASAASAPPTPSFVTAEQNDCSNSLHSTHQLTPGVSLTTTPMSQVPITGEHSTVSAEQFPTAMEECTDQPTTTEENSSSVEVPTPDCDICSKVAMNEDIDTNEHDLERLNVEEQVNTDMYSAQSSVVSEQARTSTASEVEPDQLLVQEVEEFVEKLMECVVNDMNAEDTAEVESDQLLVQEVEEFVEELMECVVNGMNAEDTAFDVPQLPSTLPDLTLAPNPDGQLTLSTVESSITEFYSCYSESMRTDTSFFCSLTSMDEDHKTKDYHETFLTPHQSSEEQGSNAMADVATCTEEVSFFTVEDEASGKESVCTGVVTDGQLPSPDVPTKKRSESCVFQVTLMQGLLGVGLTLGSDDLKEVAVQKIRMFSPAAIQGQLRVGDRILEINGHSVIGKSPSQAQTMLSQSKWGEEVTILAMPPQETVVFHYSEAANAGVITMKLNTSFDKPLGVDIEGGSDTECPYIHISAIKCGSVADRCGMLRVGDELLEIDQHLMVGTTHREATDILGHISRPITLTVQRRENLNLKDRIQTHHSEEKLTNY